MFRRYGEDLCVIEHEWIGTVPGAFLGIPGRGRRISFRMLHVWTFRGGLISREHVWLDTGAIVRQLTAEHGPREADDAASAIPTTRQKRAALGRRAETSR